MGVGVVNPTNDKMKKKDQEIVWIFIYGIGTGLILLLTLLVIFGNAPFQLKQELQSCQEKIQEFQKNEVIYETYYLVNNDSVKVHTTTYFPYNHSYTIDKPFTCDNIVYFGEFESYLENCKSPLIK